MDQHEGIARTKGGRISVTILALMAGGLIVAAIIAFAWTRSIL